MSTIRRADDNQPRWRCADGVPCQHVAALRNAARTVGAEADWTPAELACALALLDRAEELMRQHAIAERIAREVRRP